MKNTRIIGGLLCGCLITSVGSACADTDDGVERPLTSPFDAENAAEGALWAALQFNSAVHSAIALAKDDGQPGSFVLFEAIHDAVTQTGVSNEYAVKRAADQVLEQMLMADEDQLAARVYALLSRFSDLISQPRASIPPQLLGEYVDDSIDLTSELEVKLTSQALDRKKRAYYFATAYNVVVNAYCFAYAAAYDSSRRSIEHSYRDAITTNIYLVGTGEGDDHGYLFDWIAEQTAGSASPRMKFEKDPVVYSVRRALEEQQRALE